jgi:F0F1-type ATP synthase assembly protein I
MVKKTTKKREKILSCEQRYGGLFVGSILLGTSADFFYKTWPAGIIGGLGMGFILLSLGRIIRE